MQEKTGIVLDNPNKSKNNKIFEPMTQEDIDKIRKILPSKKIYGEIGSRLLIDDSTVRKCFNRYDDENMGHIKIIQTAIEILEEIEELRKKVALL